MAQANYGYLPVCTGWNTDCPNFYKIFREQLKISSSCKGSSPGCLPNGYHGIEVLGDYWGYNYIYISNIKNKIIYVLLSGEYFFTYDNALNVFVIDINGRKKPNKWGYDIHIFNVNTNTSSIGAPWNFVEKGGTSTQNMVNKIKNR